ncbi:hypothetical protein QJQ45_009928 [Haematococcus lacustris]|nr:hypothetical protein QJQ45_009928 [Haematococcus lacustris]
MSDAHDLVDGRFRLQRLLVQTNMSQVWFARDVRFGRRVVIKAAQHSSASATSELGVLKSLPPHPHIIQLLHSFQTRPDAGRSPQLLCLVLERLGPSLSSLTRQATEPGSGAGRGASPLPLHEVKRMAQQVLAALSHLHRPRPQDAAAWKLLDFGNACQPQPLPWAAQLAPYQAWPLHDGGHGLPGLDHHESEPKQRWQEAHPWMQPRQGHNQGPVQAAGQLGCRLVEQGKEEEEGQGQEVLVTPAYAGPEEWLGLLPPTSPTPQHSAMLPTTCSCAHLPSTYHKPSSHTNKCGGLHGGSGSRDHRRCDQAEQGSGRGWEAEAGRGDPCLPAHALRSCGLPWACPGNDMWGLGCLVYEAATGYQLLSPHRVRTSLAAAAAAASDCEGTHTSGSNYCDGVPTFSPWAKAGQQRGGCWVRPVQGWKQQLVWSRVEEIEDEELLLWQMSRVLGPFPPEVLVRASLTSADLYFDATGQPLLDKHPAARRLTAASPSTLRLPKQHWFPNHPLAALDLWQTLAGWGGGAEQLLRGLWPQGQREGAGGAGEPVWLRPLPYRLAAEAPHLNPHEVAELAAFLTPLLDYDPFARPSAAMVHYLLSEYAKAPTTEVKQQLAYQIIRELAMHASKEEEVLYPAVKSAFGNEEYEKLLGEHTELKKALATLSSMNADKSEAAFDAQVASVKQIFEAHYKEEEDVELPKLLKAEGVCKMKLGEEFEKAAAHAVTRPHTWAPDKAPLNKITNMMTAPLDAAADIIRFAGNVPSVNPPAV